MSFLTVLMLVIFAMVPILIVTWSLRINQQSQKQAVRVRVDKNKQHRQ